MGALAFRVRERAASDREQVLKRRLGKKRMDVVCRRFSISRPLEGVSDQKPRTKHAATQREKTKTGSPVAASLREGRIAKQSSTAHTLSRRAVERLFPD